MITLLVVGEIRLYREGLAWALERAPDVQVVGVACSGDEAINRVRDQCPAVVLLDLAMPESSTTASALTQLQPPAYVVALGAPGDGGDDMAYAKAGFSGWVPREGSLEDLLRVVRAVVVGELVCTAKTAGRLLRQVQSLAGAFGDAQADHLTRRQLEILSLVDQGLCNKEIAYRLGIELSTVKNHIHNTLERLHAANRSRAAAMVRPFLPLQTGVGLRQHLT